MIAKFISLILVSIVSGLDDEGEWRLEIHSNSVLHGYHHHLPTIAPGPLTRQELQSEDRATAEITESMIDAIEYISLADKQMSQSAFFLRFFFQDAARQEFFENALGDEILA